MNSVSDDILCLTCTKHGTLMYVSAASQPRNKTLRFCYKLLWALTLMYVVITRHDPSQTYFHQVLSGQGTRTLLLPVSQLTTC